MTQSQSNNAEVNNILTDINRMTQSRGEDTIKNMNNTNGIQI